MVRKLAYEGHKVYAADDQSLSPGNHSRYLAGRFVYPSPRRDTAGFLAELEWIAGEHEIDVIVPTFEEAFYISTQLARLSRVTEVFASPFRTLACLHDKVAFERLVARLGLPIPETVVVRSGEELSEATGPLERYFARAVFSRGGVCCLTNTGPLAGALDMDEVHPTPVTLAGAGVCGRRDGLHLQHRPWGSCELSPDVPDPPAAEAQHRHPVRGDRRYRLKLIEPIVAELGYTGQISFDFLVTDDGLTFVECNPRATDGLLLMPREELAAGLLAPRPETFVLEPGGHVQLPLAVLADGFSDHLKRLPKSIGDLAQVRDAGSGWHDPLPTLYSALAICHLVGQSTREHMGQIVTMAGDMNWDGEPIDGMSNDDAMLLTGLRPQPGET